MQPASESRKGTLVFQKPLCGPFPITIPQGDHNPDYYHHIDYQSTYKWNHNTKFKNGQKESMVTIITYNTVLHNYNSLRKCNLNVLTLSLRKDKLCEVMNALSNQMRGNLSHKYQITMMYTLNVLRFYMSVIPQ